MPLTLFTKKFLCADFNSSILHIDIYAVNGIIIL